MVPKSTPGKFRPISVPSYIDRCLQALYAMALEPYSETVASRDSYGFRKGRSPIWAALRLQSLLNNPAISIPNIIELDIEGCFDNIDHKSLLEDVPQNFVPRNILWQWLKSGYALKSNPNVWIPTPKGTPQGSLISPILSNITLNNMDPRAGTTTKYDAKLGPQCYYIRFADDVVILVPPKVNPIELLEKVKTFLATSQKLKRKSLLYIWKTNRRNSSFSGLNS
jgi:RNA-directed DNA polymerase